MNAIEAAGLTVELPAAGYRRPVLDDLTFAVPTGRTVGIVGESGSGKSMLSRAMLGELPRGALVAGSLRVNGTELIGAPKTQLRNLRRNHIAMIFQDPRASVNPVHRIGDFLTETVVRSGRLSERDARTRAVGLLSELRLRDPEGTLRRYPSELSGGMLQRVVIAAALMVEPGILLWDEGSTALDVTTQHEIVTILRRMVEERGMTLVFVTHDLDLASDVCQDLLVLYAGQVLEAGPARAVLDTPKNPYTEALLASMPRLDGPPELMLPTIPGQLPPLTEPRHGCIFADRCQYTRDDCRTTDIPVHQFGPQHTRCIHPELPMAVTR